MCLVKFYYVREILFLLAKDLLLMPRILLAYLAATAHVYTVLGYNVYPEIFLLGCIFSRSPQIEFISGTSLSCCQPEKQYLPICGQTLLKELPTIFLKYANENHIFDEEIF